MKTSNYFFISIIFLLFINLTLLSGDIEFNISLNKEIFLERESIWVKCQVKNNGSAPKKTLKISDATVFYLIPEDSNNYLDNVRIFIHLVKEPLTILKPRESMESFANLLKYYSSSHKSRLSGRNRYALNPGRYKIYVRYYTRWSENKEREDIYSDTLEFEVIPPIGEEKEALLLFEKGKYIEVFEKYPESIYAHSALQDYVYRNPLSSLNKQERKNLIEVFMKQFEKYPDSPTIEYLNLQTFLQLHLDMGVLKEGRTKLKKISEKHPESYLSKLIKDLLKSTERNSIYSIEDTTKE